MFYYGTNEVSPIIQVGSATPPTPVPSFTGTVDAVGLAAIGWGEDDISYLQANVWWNEEDDDLWLVPDYDKQCWQDYLDGVIDFSFSLGVSNNIGDYCPLLTFSPKFDTSGFTYTSYVFRYCYYLVASPVMMMKKDGTSGGNGMFDNCCSLKCVPQIDTNVCVKLDSMFNCCHSLQSIPELDTSSVTTMRSMFNYCSSLQSIPELDTSSVTDMSGMFYGCSSLTAIPELDTSSVTNMSGMFYSCHSLQSIPELDTSSVTTMSGMFYSGYSLQSIPELDTSSVTTMSGMFYSCSSLQSIPDLDTSSVTDMSGMFMGCYSLQNCYIKNIGVSIALSDSLYLSVESMVYIMEHAQTVSTGTLTFGSTNLAKLTDEQKAIATDKGWTLA